MAKKTSKYKKETEIPVMVIKTFEKKNSFDFERALRSIGCLILIFCFMFTRVPTISAYEAHRVNVTARICNWSESRSMGYWKNHPQIYVHYLPQHLGNHVIDMESKAEIIFENAGGGNMYNMLKAQLLATKFNIAHFGIGGYLVEDEKTLFELVAEADDMLRQDPLPPKEVMEQMKDALDAVNNLHQVRHCFSSNVKVEVPNGGEVWWVGRSYDLLWSSTNIDCATNSIADIWYSTNSGQNFANVVEGTENDGVYNWRIPLFLGDLFVPSDRARIKVVIKCSDTLETKGQDMSDEDFCPPIDFSLLTEEERAWAYKMGLLVNSNTVGVVVTESTSIEEIATSTEEIQGGIVIEENSTSTEPEATSTESEATSTEEFQEEQSQPEEPAEESSTSTEPEFQAGEVIEEAGTSTGEIAEETPTSTESEATSTEEASTEEENSTSTEEIKEPEETTTATSSEEPEEKEEKVEKEDEPVLPIKEEEEEEE